MNGRKTVVIGLLGPTLDAGHGPGRWDRWRPTVSIGAHEDLLVSRLELLHQAKFAKLAKTIADDLRAISPETEVRLHQVEMEDAWDFSQVYEALHGFARGYRFDVEAEDYLVHITTGTHVAQICLFLLTEARYLPARLLQTSPPPRLTAGRGAMDRPGDYQLIDLDLSKYDRLASRFQLEQRDAVSFLKAGIATRNAVFNGLIEQIERVAVASRSPILLTGPTGAGKTHLARRIYELKRARQKVSGRFVEVNCATLRGDGAMSALFGHVKGAFTGAQQERAGLLRAADGGLLFLDEIGELGADEQAMLLRALESKRFLPVGADREVESDFLLLAGTNRDLQEGVAAGRFREDLLARINTWTFRLPALRERPEDLEPNLDFELERFAEQAGSRVTMSAEARRAFLAFARSPDAAWAGNFRDLNAAVVRMATLAEGGRITEAVVTEELARLRRSWRPPADAGGDLVVEVLGEARAASLDRFDRVQLADVLRVCAEAPTLSEAGRRLFSQSRLRQKASNDADRLRKYLARFDLAWDDVAGREKARAGARLAVS